MQHYQLLGILALGFVFALAFGFFTQKLGLSSIVGYLIAGFCIGPLTPGFVADYDLAFQLSEAGVILLMFGVGLHFDLKELWAVKWVAIPGAIIQSTVATVFGIFIGIYIGLELHTSLILGLALAVASTVVLIRVLTDNNTLDTPQGHAAVGWLVVEDILTVLILVILPSIADILLSDSGEFQTLTILKMVGLALLRLGMLWVIVIEVGGRLVPIILHQIAKTRSEELFTLAVLVMAFATAVAAAFIFQASLALGAFLGGVVVGRTKLGHHAGSYLLPLKDAFAVLFFLSVGILLEPHFILKYPTLIIACVVIVLIIKPLTALITVVFLGYSPKTALTVALGLAQVGEFSFILVQEAKMLGLAGDQLYNAIVICAIITITLNPTIFRQEPKLERFLMSKEKLWGILNYFAEKKWRRGHDKLSHTLSKHKTSGDDEIAIVVGYGHIGQKIVALLREYHIKTVVIDMNIDTINALHNESMDALFGNCVKKEILQAAGIHKAAYLIITIPNFNTTVSTASLAALLNPKTHIFARARFLNTQEQMCQAGVNASDIIYEEEEAAKGLHTLLLNHLKNQSDND